MNPSGIEPKGNRVLVKPSSLKEELGELRAKMIPDEVLVRYQNAQRTGDLFAVGKDAWCDMEEPFAETGDRVLFTPHAGILVLGEDGEEYRVMNDLDVVATVSEKVSYGELMKREPLSGVG